MKKAPIKTENLPDVIDWGILSFESQWKPDKGLGPTDQIYDYIHQWPIYNLDYFNPESLYYKFQEQLKNIQKKCSPVSLKELSHFLDENLQIHMELCIFEELLDQSFYFKIRNKLYCYCMSNITSKSIKTQKWLKFRFLFDPFKVLNLSR